MSSAGLPSKRFRVGQRRALADLSPFDFVAAVAVGSIAGLVPNASDAS